MAPAQTIASRIGAWLGMLVLLFGSTSGLCSDNQASVLGVTIATRDGLVTALFDAATDDAALKNAAPYLTANGVRSVVLRDSLVRDIAPLAMLPDVVALDLGGTQVRDLSPLGKLTNLRVLNLRFLRINGIGPLAGLHELRALNLEGTDVGDLRPLAGLAALRDLSAAVTRVHDLTPLKSLTQLASLNLGSTWVADLAPLEGLTELHFLSLNGTPVTDVRPLVHMLKMQTLDLGGTGVGDIHALAGMHDLRSLNLEATLVADVSPLTGMRDLQSLALGGSRAQDTSLLPHLLASQAPAPKPPEADPVLVWNDQTNRAVQATNTDAFEASRALALESLAVLDTVKSIDGTAAFMVRLTPPPGVFRNAAVSAAAHTALLHLFPTRQVELDATMASAIAHEPAGPDLDRSIAFGEAMADALLMLRDGDGSMTDVTLAPRPGGWVPTPPDFVPAAHPHWGEVRPFALNQPDQFRPDGPPAPSTNAFRLARAEVEAVGERDSVTRTQEQTEIAQYWSDALGTYAPAGHWNTLAANVVAPMHLGTAVEAELFAELNVAMADAGIAMADAKYTYWSQRPVTVIRPAQPAWMPLLETPAHPSYVSGHSSFSGAAATVLTAWFGTHPFSFTAASQPNVTRRFDSFQQAADEAAMSRLYGGIHFRFDNADGLTIGRSVGAWTMAVFSQIGQDRGPAIIIMDRSMASGDPHRFTGCALDNLSPVTQVTVQLDNDPPFGVAVDARGHFILPPDRIGSAGPHLGIVTATSVSGRHGMTQVRIE